ncbi:ricin-type beta-trefoil lectin domain protein [Catelliglobosispora koreensis]|uniref:ricin-type beta-trefoil lectin domain protein n=1 Tax=Catelliglobosispora koreensis TaxID=129052 RepID=UPI000379B97B|nr:ricin-type beta-trefoil lectin domain protein [Catelliglobosispora koreensis]
MASSRPKRSLARTLACALTALTAIPLGIVGSATPAAADTSQFIGVNWARTGDNFHGGTLVLHGLSSTDSYATVKAKADVIYAGFQNNLGINTVRLPINTYTVGTAWWNSYTGAIDAATARGIKVVLSYWEDGVAASGGRVVNTSAFNSMWNTVVAKYGANSLVYFEPMNEPGGHSATEWANIAATWITSRPSVPRNRIFVSGAGLNTNTKAMCADSRLDGTVLSLHHYTFFSGAKTYDQWVSYLKDAIGTCASRTVIDEFGAPMDTGLNYHDANSTDNFVRYLRATTAVLRELRMGSIYWPGLGGKITAGQSDDWYSLQKMQGSGTNLTLTTPNVSGAQRLKYGWGIGGTDPVAANLRNVGTGRCLDIPGGTGNVQTQVSTCSTSAAQQWTVTATGQITVLGGQKCLDAYGQGTSNGTVVGTYDCNGGANQRWAFNSDGTIRGVQSGLCVDVNQSTFKVQLWSCWGGNNQKWQTYTP